MVTVAMMMMMMMMMMVKVRHGHRLRQGLCHHINVSIMAQQHSDSFSTTIE